MKTYPRVLVISNNSFSKSNSNGRTLGSLFLGWPKDRLAQFCISTDTPDFELCENYYCVGDRAVLRSALKLCPVQRNDLRKTAAVNAVKIPANRIKRTPIKSILRHMLWSAGIWKGRQFKEWLDQLAPEIVVLQSGDTAFPHNLATDIVHKYGAKLVFFNTEGIYFFKTQYLYKGWADCLFFPIYRALYKRAYERAMHAASYAVYLNKELQNDNKCFGVESTVIYNSTSIVPITENMCDSELRFTYMGNFGFNRAHALKDIAEALKSISSTYVLDVYGRANPEIEAYLNSVSNIRYNGFVSYNEVLDIIKRSTIIFHAESQDSRFNETLRYGFSTKIADSLGSGRPFVLYASPSIACAKYIVETGAAWFVGRKEDLPAVIAGILNDPEATAERVKRSVEIAHQNHNAISNSSKFQQILMSL